MRKYHCALKENVSRSRIAVCEQIVPAKLYRLVVLIHRVYGLRCRYLQNEKITVTITGTFVIKDNRNVGQLSNVSN